MEPFAVGHVIHHRRYDYRGVIANVDFQCEAPDEWYYSNNTQPNREQPWYHVLVDGGHETYVAQENLEPDDTGLPVNHPIIERLFP